MLSPLPSFSQLGKVKTKTLTFSGPIYREQSNILIWKLMACFSKLVANLQILKTQDAAITHMRKFSGFAQQHIILILKECKWRFNMGSPKQLLDDFKSILKNTNLKIAESAPVIVYNNSYYYHYAGALKRAQSQPEYQLINSLN